MLSFWLFHLACVLIEIQEDPVYIVQFYHSTMTHIKREYYTVYSSI